MKGLILTLFFLSSTASAFAQEKIWLDNNYKWTNDSTQAIKYALISEKDKKHIKVEEFTLDGLKKDVWHFLKYGNTPSKRKREGLHTAVYANGKDSLVEVYKDNRIEGQAMVYYPDGSPQFVLNYKDGHIDGKLLQYYPDGKLRREEYYSEYQCTDGKFFDKDGNQITHQPYIVYPSFPGGIENLLKLVANVTKYPEEAMKRRAEGRVIIQFTLNEGGYMESPEVIQSVSYDIDKEAIRAFKAIAEVYRWSPGYQDGEAKRIKYTIPLYFKIPQ